MRKFYGFETSGKFRFLVASLVAVLVSLSFAACDSGEEAPEAGSESPSGEVGNNEEAPGEEKNNNEEAPGEEEGEQSTEPEEPAVSEPEVPEVPVVVEPINGVPAPGAVCPYLPTKQFGVLKGDLFKDMNAYDCDGNIVSLQESTCGAAVTWLFFTTQWCPYCKDTIRGMEKELNEFYPKGLRIVIVNWQNNKGTSPTFNDCRQYRNTFPTLAGRDILWTYDPLDLSSAYYETSVVSLSVVLNRFGEIIDKNNTTLAGAVSWSIRQEFKKMDEELGQTE